MSVRGKVALITGGSDGIGRAAAELFAARGARVVIAARNAERGEARPQARAAGGDAATCHRRGARDGCAALFALPGASRAARLRLQQRRGEPGGKSRVHEQRAEQWTDVVDVHLGGIFWAMKHEIPALLASGGAIVNMSSMYGLAADGVAYPAYVASKHGAIGLTRSAALQYARKNLRVNAVCPGVARTPMLARSLALDPALEPRFVAMHPMRRLAEPTEVAEAVLWLCSDAASFVTGAALPVDGGATAAL
jgi:NAD(P)-dependent dehydrogenase (short-subunit alcohol dehydrogenase family)